MYEDSWYSYVPEFKKDDVSHVSKHQRRESMLKQPNVRTRTTSWLNGTNDVQGDHHILESASTVMEAFHEDSGLEAPPRPTLIKRAKSLSDFYEDADGYPGKDVKEKPQDVLELLDNGQNYIPLGSRFEEYEDGLLNASQDEYR